MSNFGERTLIREFTIKSNGEVVRVYEHSGVEIESISLRDVKNREAEIREEFVIHLDSLGHMVNFKTRKQSYRSKKKLENPPDQWKIFENTHEAIIDEETFARVQELRKNKRRPARTGKTNMFSDLVHGAGCGEKLYYCTSNSFETRQDHFVCSTSPKKGKEVCDTHFIRAMVLEAGTLQHMRMVFQCVADYEDTFRRALGAKRSEEAKKELSAKKRILQKAEIVWLNWIDCSSVFMRIWSTPYMFMHRTSPVDTEYRM